MLNTPVISFMFSWFFELGLFVTHSATQAISICHSSLLMLELQTLLEILVSSSKACKSLFKVAKKISPDF